MSFEDVRALTQGILKSQETRAAGLAALHAQTQAQLHGAQAQLQQGQRDLQALAHRLHTDLANMRANMRQGDVQRQAAVNDWMKNVVAAHDTMARQQHAHLAHFCTELRQGEAQRSSNVSSWIAQTASDRQAMGQTQRANLGKARSDLAQGEQRRSAATHSWLQAVAAAQQTMANQQRSSLAKTRSDLARTRSELARNEARRSGEANGWLGKIATSRAAGHAEWRRMEEALHAKKLQGAVAPAPPAAPPPPEALSEEEAIARVQVGQMTPEFANLRSRAFDYLANRPDGTRLVEMEQALGVSRIHMARVVGSLMDEGKAEKRDLLYFAI
ncbi:MAG: hypothetical protein HYY01_14080 [Chloroflexi bacterium]|nr:hypothetical protein [Chloroflexota bacterium]